MRSRWLKLFFLSALLGIPSLVVAQTASAPANSAPATQAQIAALQQAVQNAQSAGDNAWMLISAALVLLMTGPGLALFYGGLVRKKNILGTMMQSFAMMGLVTVIWAVVGYSLAFGHGNSFIGGFEHMFLRGVGLTPNTDYAATIPEQTYMIYQLMFAIITPALITGAFAERMKFSAMALFLSLWSIFVYCPMAHMVWGVGGLLNATGGAHSQPGLRGRHGGSRHLWSFGAGHLHLPWQARRLPANPHAAAFHGAQLHWRLPAVGWLVRIQRRQRPGRQPIGHLSAFINTHFAAAAAAIGWVIAEWIHTGKPTALGGISGAVAGLVAITPASGFVQPFSALAIGLVAGIFCSFMVFEVKSRLGYDDSLDAFGVHGAGGTLGALLTGCLPPRPSTRVSARMWPRAQSTDTGVRFLIRSPASAIAWSVSIVGTLDPAFPCR